MKRVLITGAGRGIGLELARQSLARGDRVIATVRDPARAAALEALANDPASRGELVVERLDVGDPASIDALAERVSARLEGLDLLVSNAGISSGSRDFAERGPASRLGELSGPTLAKLFAVNATGPLLVAQRLLPLLERGERPRVLFLSTQLASLANKTQGGNYAYGASKAALNMFGRTLANDLRQNSSPVLVALAHPGWVQTDMGGPQAPLSVEESVRGLLALIDGWRPEDSGRFVDYQGQPLPW